jgi:ABC-type transport system, involved in lipoprotein release, permease component
MTFSKVFIIIQNILTISLLAAAFIIANQVKHLIDAPLEYNNKDIIYHVNEVGPYTEFQSLDNELNNLASVKRTAFSQGTPFNRGNNNTFVHDGQNISMQILNGDSAFFDMMGFEILKDNHTSNVGKIYLNEQAYKELNLDDDAATVPEMNWSLDGKVKDFQLGNILGQTKPVAIGVADVNNFYPWNILIETQGDPGVAYQQVKEVYERVTGLNFKGEYMEDQIAETFAAQQRLLKIIAVFCGIAILISMLGLMAISTYFIRQRSKEIAIRKTMGSTNANIVLRLIGSFLIYVLIAFIITVPVMYYIMTGWLEDYSYRISISPWFFILAGLFSLLISFITVFFQSYRASTANPVDYLKNE